MDAALLRYLYSRYSRLKSRMTNSCVFCNIANDKAGAEIVYRDDQITAFRDIHPVGPTHILIIPNRHIESVNEMQPEDKSLIGHMVFTAGQIAAQEKIAQDGYRLILNTGPNGGQTVFHLHLHLIGGQRMRHPMG